MPMHVSVLACIRNNNLTADDDIARQKRCMSAQAKVLARTLRLCNMTINCPMPLELWHCAHRKCSVNLKRNKQRV